MMLTALQAQLELGDVNEAIHDYRPIACHCLPARLVPILPQEGVAMHHQSLRGMTPSEAKQAFLNLIQSWPLHKATIFDVMVRDFMLFAFILYNLCVFSNRLLQIGLEFCGSLLIRKASTFSNTAHETHFVPTTTAVS
jgi:hypothetical protein